MTSRPFGLTPADLPGIATSLAERREAFFRSEAAARGWPEDPAELTSEQIIEIVTLEGWPEA